MDAYDGYALSKGITKPASRTWTQDEKDELERMIEMDNKRTGKQ